MKEKKRVAALLSTGKDSVFALYKMQEEGYPVVVALTMHSENEDSYMYHAPSTSLASLQAEALGLPLLEGKTKGVKEIELEDLKELLVRAKLEYGVEGVVSGALFSDYQRQRLDDMCADIGLETFAPLWHLDQAEEVKQIIDAGFEVIITRVAAEGLTQDHLGVRITDELLEEFQGKLGLNVAGEGGEYESLVLDGPNFSQKIVVDEQVVSGGDNNYLLDVRAHLENK